MLRSAKGLTDKGKVNYYLTRTKGVNDCLEWQGSRDRRGYGIIYWKGNSRVLLHRVIYSVLHPAIDLKGLSVRHTCDNPSCINPEHLIHGTHSDNMQDCSKRGRSPLAKLTVDQVREVRMLHSTGKYNYPTLASMFGVERQAIGRLIRGDTYKYID